jgi:hypothetical protein
MISKLLCLCPLLLCSFTGGCTANAQLDRTTEPAAAPLRDGFVVLPSSTNAVQFRLFTNAAPDSVHLFNTIEIEAYGESLLRSAGGGELKNWLATSSRNAFVHNILVNGEGPQLSSSNSMIVSEQASGPDWSYIALDGSAAYRGQLQQFKRGLLFVEPGLFVLYDHLVAKEPSSFQMLLHPPAATYVDNTWGDLRLELSKAGMRVHAPAPQKKLRHWQRIESAADQVFTGTVTMQLNPANKMAELNLLTVFDTHRGGEKKELAFRLLEGNNTIGARIHRDGLPTLVAFRTDSPIGKASLTGFEFNGPVGVSVFKPKTPR